MTFSRYYSKCIYAIICIFFTLSSCNTGVTLSKKQRAYLDENPDLNVGIYINYPPYEFVNAEGEIDGILLDYFGTIEDKIEHTFDKKFYSDWSTLVNDAKKGTIDIILEIQNTKERRKYLTFTKPIFKGNHVIITRNDSSITSLKQLSGKKVTVGKSYAIEEYLEKEYPDIILVPKKDEEEGLKALANHEVDAFIGLEAISNYLIQKEAIDSLTIKTPIKYANELGIAIHKEKPILATIIKKGNNAISLDEKNEILNKWLYNIVVPFHQKATFWEILLLVVAVLLVFFFGLSYYLKRQVSKRTKALEEAKTIAERSNTLKTLFLQNISHEVRTPLNSIIGFANFLQKEHISEDEKKEYISTILQESDNLTKVLNNVIEISELTTKNIIPNYQIINIHKEVETLSEIYTAKAAHKKLDFTFIKAKNQEEKYIKTDKTRFTKAIGNILNNAIKFTNSGNVTLQYEVQSEHVEITVTDTGIGIRPEKFETIFDEFYQEEKELSKKYDGLGIGLSIAKENIRSLGGEIKLQANQPNGSVFTIYITKENFSDEDKIKPPKTVDSAVKILIAEDMKLNYIVLQKVLNNVIKNEKEIIWAKNGQEAIDFVKESNFDIVFMDIKMPILNGYEATKQIKALNPDIPVIAQTAYAHEEDINRASTIGFDGYLTKPLNTSALKVVLEDLLALHFNIQ
ncbi:transporter substrate-binding domain-containing protein [uncultured Kordia sp.]|uniref:response regulator n=1 Tax=uncultured Kordia sp. TaxID=507699 RepID=UPI00260519FC|nr:transporter substrate-binding domain-containing protein [uncultured Kordia sp.]